MRQVLLALLLLFVSVPAFAQTSGESLTISLLTMGPGEHPFTKFGHSAIWVHDSAERRDEVYNYGTFAFDSATLVLDSVRGELPYWLSVQSLSSTLATYRAQHRSLLASELELTPAQRFALLTSLRDNARPEHRYYRYKYFRDNCATRVRDAIDRVVGGALRAQGGAPASMSYREHTLRLAASDPVLAVALDWALGRQTDAPVAFWDEAFLPDRLHELLAHTTVKQDDETLPLLRHERQLLVSPRADPANAAPHWFGFYWGVGLCFGAALALLGAAAPGRPRAQRALSLLTTTIALPLGLIGCAIAYLTWCSAHSAAASNYNVLLLPPWLLALPIAALSVGQKKPWAIYLWRTLTLATLATTLLVLGLHVLLQNPQANGRELAFALPLWLGASVSSICLGGGPVAAPPSTTL